jgi:lysophospholipase L1-like esterase
MAIAIIAFVPLCLLTVSKEHAPIDKSTHQALRRGVFALSRMEGTPIVMLGDSLTEGAPWNELTGCPRVANRGINGDATMGVLGRLDDVFEVWPRAVFLMIGVNDLANGIPQAAVVENLRKILDRLDKSGIPYFLNHIVPVTRTYKKAHLNGEIDTLNALTSDLVVGRPNAATIDLRPLLRDGTNSLAEEYSYDGLHLSPKGYQVWRDAIAPIIARFCAQ